MSAIVPRWEWRTFGDHFGAGEDRIAALSPERTQESDELYLLSTAANDSVKVRGGLMDVKYLEEVNDEGLEQWRPVMKAEFPLAAQDAGSVLLALGVPDVPIERTSYSLAELIDELVGPSPQLAGVKVHKERRRYIFGGCLAELTEVRADGKTTRTIAVESEDAARVTTAVRELGLESSPNTSYPRELKSLLGFA